MTCSTTKRVWFHLVKQCIQHADTEHPACSKRQPEHESQVGALITLYLKRETHRKLMKKRFEEQRKQNIIIRVQQDFASVHLFKTIISSIPTHPLWNKTNQKYLDVCNPRCLQSLGYAATDILLYELWSVFREFQSLSGRIAHLLQFGESEWVAVLGSELHEPHVGRVCELSDDAETGKQPEWGLGGLRERERERERC